MPDFGLWARCLSYGYQKLWTHPECAALAKSFGISAPPTPTTASTHPAAPQSTSQPANAGGANTSQSHTPSSPQATSTNTVGSNGPSPNNDANTPAATPNSTPNSTTQGDSGTPTSSQPSVTGGPASSQPQPGSDSEAGSSGHTQSGAGVDNTSSPLLPGQSSETGRGGVASPTQKVGNTGSGFSDSSRSIGAANPGDPPAATNTFAVEGVGAAGKKSNTGAIVGGVLGVLAVLALLILTLLLMRRRRRRARVAPSAEFMQRFQANSPSLQTTPRASGAPYSDDQTNLPSYSQGQYPFVVHEKSPMYP